jgi:hypothetical protein
LKTHFTKQENNVSNTPEITPELIAEAKLMPGGWVYKVDWQYKEDQHTPPEAIIGGFEVDNHGVLTGNFQANPNYRAVKIANRPPRDYMNRSRPAHQCNQWVIEIDPDYDDKFPDVPPEGQIGRWYVGPDGKLTGQFRPNPHYTGSIKT